VSALFSFVMLFFSRYFHLSHIGYCVALLLFAFLFAVVERDRVSRSAA
jgi:hypothetical protein